MMSLIIKQSTDRRQKSFFNLPTQQPPFRHFCKKQILKCNAFCEKQVQLILFGLIIYKAMFRLTLLATFFHLLLAINNYNISLPFDGTENPLTGDFNGYYSPSYPLGLLSKGYSLSIKATLKNKNTQSLSGLTITLYQKDNGGPSAFKAITLQTVTSTLTLLQYSYDITFAGTVTSAAFQLRAIADTFIDFNFFSLDVSYYKTSEGPTSKKAKSILKVTETQRHSILRMVFVASPTELDFTLYPATSALSNFDLTLKPILQSDWTRTNGWRVESQAIETSSTFNDLLKVQSMKSVAPVKRGFYLLHIIYSTATPKDFIRITYQTDSFKCPYDSFRADYYHSFQGCTQKPGSLPLQGEPCISFNEVTGQCVKCLEGYNLVNDACTANTSCPDRKYFHFGECLDVSSSCGNYDSFTGACLTCSDQYVMVSKACIPKPVLTCKERQYIFNQTCLNVSQACATFNSLNGWCLSCAGNHYQLNDDGTCTPTTVICPQGNYAVGNNCVPIQIECLKFNETNGDCEVCIRGFSVQNGTCQKIVCPGRQVPSRFGLNCVDVSDLCVKFDSEDGDCLSCKSGYVLRNGKCLQVVSPLGGCRERESLGFGKCINQTTLCKTYDESGKCSQCEDDSYLDYMGRCVPKPPCGSNQYSVNGECISLPPNCLAVDRHNCVQCDHQYREVSGQCVFFKTCQPGEYLNDAGTCVNVKAGCMTWNPSNGECIACLDETVQPSDGACCPSGFFYSKIQDSCVLQLPTSECEVRHRSLKLCLKCKYGHSADYSVPYGCVRD